MGITSCGSFNQPASFLLTAIYFVHITILTGKRDTTCPIMSRAAAGGTPPPVRFALVSPDSARIHSVKTEGLKATPAPSRIYFNPKINRCKGGVLAKRTLLVYNIPRWF